MALDADAVVIGGGPAGSAVARLLAQWNRSVVLIARTPGKRPIAESLPPSCARLLDQLELRQVVDRAGFLRAAGNTVRWANGEARTEWFPNRQFGLQVPRDRFDALLLAGAQAAGAHVIRDATVRSVTHDGEHSTVAYEPASDAGAHRRCRARWVLDCSGRAGLVARAGWRQPEVAERTIAVVAIFESDRWRGAEYAAHTLVESHAAGWAWSVPVSETRRYVTVMLDPRHTALPSRRSLLRAYRNELAETKLIADLVHDAQLVEEPWGCDASPYGAASAGDAAARTLLVGDAATFIDPLSSFGVKKALASAWLAAIVVNSVLDEPALSQPAIALFDRRERDMYRELRRAASSLARDAASAHAGDFWTTRLEPEHAEPESALDAAVARRDPRVLDAFDELKRRDAVRLRAAGTLRVVQRAVVRGNRVLLEEHLAAPLLGDAARYCRNVDLVTLTRLAPRFEQVPDLFAAYNRAASPAPLPDFLGALSALIGYEMLEFENSRIP